MFQLLNNFNRIEFKFLEKKGFLSIIIPVYQDFNGLEDTIISLQSQAADKDSFEIIVANDGGNKRVKNVCKKYNVNVINIIPHQGSYMARNKALEESRGEFIAFIDADEVAGKDWLKIGLKELGLSDYVGGEVLLDKKKIKTLFHLYDYAIAFAMNEKNFRKVHYAPTANLFVKRKVFERLGGFDRRFLSGGDIEFGNRIFFSSQYIMKFSDTLIVFHPPRGYKAAIKKLRRIILGQYDLLKYYPKRFNYLSRSFLKTLFLPAIYVYKVIFKKRVPVLQRIVLIPIAFWFGLVHFYYHFFIFYFGIIRFSKEGEDRIIKFK